MDGSNANSTRIQIDSDDAFDKGIILHELGHFVMRSNDARPDEVNNSTHHLNKNCTGSDEEARGQAYSEAWAHFFALEVMAIPEKYSTSSNNTYYGGDFEEVEIHVNGELYIFNKFNASLNNNRLRINKDLSLNEGDNELKVIRKNKDKTISEDEYLVAIDNTGPILEIDHVSVNLAENYKVVKIYGQVNEDSVINYFDTPFEVYATDEFVLPIKANLDENEIELEIVDSYGNAVKEVVTFEENN